MKSLIFAFKQVKACAWILMIVICSMVVNGVFNQVSGFFIQQMIPFDAIVSWFENDNILSKERFVIETKNIFHHIETSTIVLIVVFSLISILISSLVKSFFEAMMVGVSKQAVDEKEINFEILFQYGKKHFLWFFLASILYSILFIILAIGIGIFFAKEKLLIGLILVLITIILVLISIFSYQAMVYEEVGLGKGIVYAVKMSFKGTIDGLLGAIVLIISTLILYLPIMIAYFIEVTAFTIIAVFLTVIATILLLIVLYPVTYIWLMKIYKKAR